MSPVHDELRDLLLHRLPESRARELEERLMLEDDAAERLQDATYDLLDDYAAGRLTPGDRVAVERYLLATEEGQWRLAVARGLAQRSGSVIRPTLRPAMMRSARIPFWRGPAAALLAACAVLVAVLVTRKLDHVSTNPVTTALPTVTLLADTARGQATPTIRLPSQATRVRVQAEVDSTGAPTYRMSVLDATGRPLVSVAGLRPRRAGAYVYVEAEIPARDLAPGIHRLVVAPAPALPAGTGPAAGTGPTAETAAPPAPSSWDIRGALEP